MLLSNVQPMSATFAQADEYEQNSDRRMYKKKGLDKSLFACPVKRMNMITDTS